MGDSNLTKMSIFGILFILITLSFTGCLTSGEVEGAEITHISHKKTWQPGDLMTLYIRNTADETIYDITITGLKYYVNGTDQTRYILDEGEWEDKSLEASALYAQQEVTAESHIMFPNVHTWDKMESSEQVLNNADTKVVFELSWTRDGKEYSRTQTLEHKFD